MVKVTKSYTTVLGLDKYLKLTQMVHSFLAY